MADGMQLGVVSAALRSDARSDNYVLASDGQVAWMSDETERTERAGGTGVLVGVASGFGPGGLVAATSAVRVMAKLYRPGLPKNPSQAMLQYVMRAHTKLRRRALDSGPVAMGASLTLAWLLEGRVHWVQVGGTRLYSYRHNRLVRLTPVHHQREFDMRDGKTQVSDDARLVQAFLWGSDGLGNDDELRLEPGLDAGTEYLEVGDRLVLCTQGITDAVDDVSLQDVIHHVPDPQHAAVSLAERARARGGRAHCTAIVIKVNRVPAKTLSDVRPGTGRTFY